MGGQNYGQNMYGNDGRGNKKANTFDRFKKVFFGE
jgi:hypothetical protein